MDGLHLSCPLQRRPGDAHKARQQVAQACAGLDADVVATAQLLASELFTNALDHSQGPITLRIIRDAGLRVEMSDESLDAPVFRDVGIEDEHGRGMLIVDTLATAWGIGQSPQGLGKYVWFTLNTPSPAT